MGVEVKRVCGIIDFLSKIEINMPLINKALFHA